MIYRNKFAKTVKKESVLLDKFFDSEVVSLDESLVPFKNSVECSNLRSENGALRTGYGFQEFSLTENGDPVVDTGSAKILGIWSQNWLQNNNKDVNEFLFFMLDDKNVKYFELDLSEFQMQLKSTFKEIPHITKILQNDFEAFAITSPSDSLVILNHMGEGSYPDVPKIMDACFHFERVFAITSELRNHIVYSKDKDITKWTNSNVEKLHFSDDRGRFLKFVTLDDNLYVFREFGITRLSEYGVSAEISVDHVYKSDSYIYADSIQVVGNQAIFFAKNGLFSFSGSSVKKLDADCLTKFSEKSLPVSANLNGKYFLALNLSSQNEESVNDSVFVYDVNSKHIDMIRDVDVLSFASIVSEKYSLLLAVLRGDQSKIAMLSCDGKVFDKTLKARWISSESDLGYKNTLKLIDEICLKTLYPVEIKIVSDIEEKNYLFEGKKGLQRRKLMVRGKSFSVHILPKTNQSDISNVKISYRIYQ